MNRLTPLTACLVFLIAAAGFALSYQALHAYALGNGVSFTLAWLWPLVIDGFMIVISLSILRASLFQEPVKYLWGLAILATGVSIIFNIAHAPATLAGRAVAMVAPMAMFLAFEVFILQIKRNSERVGMQDSYKALQGAVNDLQGQCKELRDEIENLDEEKQYSVQAMQAARNESEQAEKDTEKARKELTRLNKEIATALQDDTRSKLIMYYKVNPGASQNAAAEFAGVTRARVGQYLEQFREAGILNGKTAALPVNGKAQG